MRKVIALALVAAFALAGCNTIRGVGKDLSAVGNAVFHSVDD